MVATGSLFHVPWSHRRVEHLYLLSRPVLEAKEWLFWWRRDVSNEGIGRVSSSYMDID
jgi:hypothetical protein